MPAGARTHRKWADIAQDRERAVTKLDRGRGQTLWADPFLNPGVVLLYAYGVEEPWRGQYTTLRNG